MAWRRAVGGVGNGGSRCIWVVVSVFLVHSMFLVIVFGRPNFLMFVVVLSVVLVLAFCVVDVLGCMVFDINSSFPPLICMFG